MKKVLALFMLVGCIVSAKSFRSSSSSRSFTRSTRSFSSPSRVKSSSIRVKSVKVKSVSSVKPSTSRTIVRPTTIKKSTKTTDVVNTSSSNTTIINNNVDNNSNGFGILDYMIIDGLMNNRRKPDVVYVDSSDKKEVKEVVKVNNESKVVKEKTMSEMFLSAIKFAMFVMLIIVCVFVIGALFL